MTRQHTCSTQEVNYHHAVAILQHIQELQGCKVVENKS